MSSDLLTEIADAIIEFDSDKVKDLSMKALEVGLDPADVVQKGIAKGLGDVGSKFENGELFLTHLVAAAEVVKGAIKDVLEPAIRDSSTEGVGGPKVVIATVKGDIHDIGKNIVGAMLFSAGFDVIDLGKDVSREEIVSKIKETKAPLLGLSALLTTTIPEIENVIQALEHAGIRKDVKVIVGGAPVTKDWAKGIGADGYGDNAVHAVEVAKAVLGLE